MSRNVRGSLHGKEGRVVVDHRWALLARADWGIGEGGTPVEVDRAAVVRVEAQSHSSEVVAKDAKGVAGIDLEGGLVTVARRRNVVRADLVGAGQAEEHWRQEHEEGQCWELIEHLVERARAFGPGHDFLQAADSRSSGRPERMLATWLEPNLRHGSYLLWLGVSVSILPISDHDDMSSNSLSLGTYAGSASGL